MNHFLVPKNGSLNHRLLWGVSGLLVLCAAGFGSSCHSGLVRDDDLSDDPIVLPIPANSSAPNVTVLLRALCDAQKISLGVVGSDADVHLDDDPPRVIKPGETIILTLENGRLACKGLAGEPVSAGRLRLAPRAESALCSINGTAYRGSLRIEAATIEQHPWRVMNQVTLEQYVSGAVGWESVPSWPLETLKAQAVAIRSYALFTILAHHASGWGNVYDVDDTTLYLRYGGVGPTWKKDQWRETEAVVRSQRETHGEILGWEGNVFKTFFHASSGGHTASVQNVFGKTEIPPLAGTDMAEFGKTAPVYHWETSIANKELSTRLAQRGYHLGEIGDISTERSDSSGHAVSVRLRGAKGEASMAADEFRRVLGTGRDGLPSTRFRARVTTDRIVFSGRGWGHGVGLDQWASRDMAIAGMNYHTILARNYPGSKLIRPWQTTKPTATS